jgi:polysaccharide export outer membrane protein
VKKGADLKILGEADLARTVTVRPDGEITLPLLGDMMVAGMTPAQVTETLTTGLRKCLRQPMVTVTVTQTRVERTFVCLAGPEVALPGRYEIQPDWSLIEVFAAAGGLAPRAALERATLPRHGAAQPAVLIWSA